MLYPIRFLCLPSRALRFKAFDPRSSAAKLYNFCVRTLRATLICSIAALVGFAVGYGLIQYVMSNQVSTDGLTDVNTFIWGSVGGTFVGFIAFVVSALIFERRSRKREAQSVAKP